MNLEDKTGPVFLTTHEIAALLRVKERKVYDLAASGEIPHRRITGKLLFPRDEIMNWLDQGSDRSSSFRPDVLTGSHDLLLDWAVRESGCGLSTLFDGSMDGLQRFARRESALTGLHVNSGEQWNVDAVGGMGLSHCVLLHWAKRQQGFMHRSDAVDLAKATTAISDGRFALRQPGAGARQLLENLLARSAGGLPKLQSNAVYRTETEAAAAVASGEADVALGLEAAARQFKLAFSPVVREQFDLLFDQRAYFSVSVQRLVRFCQSGTFRSKAASLGGYDLTDAWQVRWLSN